MTDEEMKKFARDFHGPSTPSTRRFTWEVWSRERGYGDGGQLIRERVIAICASREIAVVEAARVLVDQAQRPEIPEHERSALYIKPGEIIVGFDGGRHWMCDGKHAAPPCGLSWCWHLEIR